MIFLGIDLHSNNFTCCFIHEDGAKEKRTFAITPDSLNEFYRYLDKNTAVIIEASTNLQNGLLTRCIRCMSQILIN
jgi:transposase